MRRVILDTNFLIDCIRFKIDLDEIDRLIDEEYKIFIPSTVLRELEKMSKGKTEAGNIAKIVLKLIGQKEFKIINMKGRNTDESIIKSVEKNDVVGTNDVELKKKLKTLRNKTIYLRAKKYLDIS